MIFPVIRYHLEHGCESFGNQEDLDWALEHGWSRIPPEGYNKGFNPSRQTFEAVMTRLKGYETGEDKVSEMQQSNQALINAFDEPEKKEEPKKKYLSQMNVTELQQECKDRGLDFTDLTKALMRKKIEKHDNRTNAHNRLIGGSGAS